MNKTEKQIAQATYACCTTMHEPDIVARFFTLYSELLKQQ